MTAVTLYCDADDLLIGSVPVHSDVDPNKYIKDATNEIDAALGSRYTTPFDLTDASLLKRHSRLLIARICVHIASGRLVLALAIPGEDSQPNAYGMMLLKQGLDALNVLASGEATLDLTTEEELIDTSAPLIYNTDSESSVEAFYDRVANPNYEYPCTDQYTDPGRFLR